MAETAHTALRRNPVLNNLSHQVLEEFAHLGRLRQYRKGEFLCLQGETWPHLFVVIGGLIKAFKESDEGRSLLVTNIYPGEVFWGLAFFEPEAMMPVRLESSEASRIYLWDRSQCLPLLHNYGELSWGICRLLTQRMLYASDIVEGLAFQPVASRLARLLLEEYPSSALAVDRRLTLDEMAARIGSTREMVCRILYRFATQGAIQINRTEFIFKDRELLEKQI